MSVPLRSLGKRIIDVPSGRLEPPFFMPDATFGFVRSVEPDDLVRCGIQAVVMNVFHLMQRPGSSVIRTLGGLHSFSGWDRPIVTDSGGFQAYSLIRRDPDLGSITSRGISYRPNGSSRRFLLTPEKSIQLQLSYGSDILVCLDDCTHVSESMDSQRESVERTIGWAKRCRSEFTKILQQRRSDRPNPLLYAVVQGGGSRQLRRLCAESLIEIGFDGYAYGGYPLDDRGELLTDMLRYTRELVPDEYPMIALGVGAPSNVARCLAMGYEMFDSSLPTRDARQGRLYAFDEDLPSADEWGKSGYHYVYIRDEKHTKNKEPISPHCDCPTCSRYKLAYIHHLFKRKDPMYSHLATIHNLRFMTLLIDRLQADADE